MGKYAKGTEVSPARSRMEIEETLNRYGADGFTYGWEELAGERGEVIQFRANGKYVRFVMRMPSRDAEEFKRTPARRQFRGPDQRLAAWEQACRQRWRALALAVKAKLEVVESGIASFESEFLAHIVLPDGKTVGSHVMQAIDAAYATGRVQGLLPAWSAGGDEVEGMVIE